MARFANWFVFFFLVVMLGIGYIGIIYFAYRSRILAVVIVVVVLSEKVVNAIKIMYKDLIKGLVAPDASGKAESRFGGKARRT